jgi:hypothetical protein
MMADKDALKDIPGEHIGGEHHSKRNLLIAVGLVVGGGLMGLFYWQSGKSDSVAIAELQHFRSAMATQCKQEQFARPAPKELNGLYADSSRMQAVVHEQLGSLERGQANCDQIIKTIKSVDFPVE